MDTADHNILKSIDCLLSRLACLGLFAGPLVWTARKFVRFGAMYLVKGPTVLCCVPALVAESAAKDFVRCLIARLRTLLVRTVSGIMAMVKVGVALWVTPVLIMILPTSVVWLA